MAAVGCALWLGSLTPASASENIGDFFAKAFGFGQQSASEQQPTIEQPMSQERSLIVRPHHRRPKVAKAEVPAGPVGPVSIYEDRTLRRGDAVMTAQGMRVFKGGDLPYRDADFVAVSDASGLSKPVTKALQAMDNVPRI